MVGVVCNSDCCVFQLVRCSRYLAQEENFLSWLPPRFPFPLLLTSCLVLQSLFYAGTFLPGESRGMEMAAWRLQHNQQMGLRRSYELPKAWSVCCASLFFSILKGLFLSTGHSGGSTGLESICSSHCGKQNRNGYNSDSPFFGNARNIPNRYSKPFPASGQGGTVKSEEYFCKVCWLKVLWKYWFTHLSSRFPLHNKWQLQCQRREWDLLFFR